MAEESVFRGVVLFFDKLGIYDVVLPFLLVFAVVFAILDKTKVFGTVKIEGEVYPKKALNAIVAFVVSFFVVGSTKLVGILNRALANTVLLLILIVFFLILVGSFFKEGEEVFLKDRWRTFFMTSVFIGIVLIFMEAIGWLQDLWDFLKDNWDVNWVASIIMAIVVIAFMAFITWEKKPTPKKSED